MKNSIIELLQSLLALISAIAFILINCLPIILSYIYAEELFTIYSCAFASISLNSFWIIYLKYKDNAANKQR